MNSIIGRFGPESLGWLVVGATLGAEIGQVALHPYIGAALGAALLPFAAALPWPQITKQLRQHSGGRSHLA